jgi:hypothetical protein
MLRHYYINKEWILSGTARRTYLVAAVLSVALFVVIVTGITGRIPETLLPLLKPLLLVGVLGAGICMVAMEYFLFGFDNSSAMKKVFWFCAMAVPLLGPPLYCFIVYLRSDCLKANESNSQTDRQSKTAGV